MSSVHKLNRFDLNLLRVFDAVFAERSVTKAAGRLSVSQTAVSHSLSRLREQLGDQLFVRVSSTIQPTHYAIELAPKVRYALEQVERIVTRSDFDPSESEHTFRIGITEYFAVLVLPTLVRKLQAEAPGTTLITMPNILTNAQALLNSNEIDFAIGYFQDSMRNMLPPRLKTAILMRDRYVCIMRADHPFAKEPLTPEKYAAAKHLAFSLNGESFGPVDRILKRHGIRRETVLRLCHYSAAPTILQNTDLIMTVTNRMADHFRKFSTIKKTAAPFTASSAPLQLVWNERVDTSVMHRWMRSKIIDVCKAL